MRMRTGLAFGLALVAVSLTSAARAEVKMTGSFVADAACPATQAIKSGKNPGNISTDAGQSYELLAGNKDAPTHYLIRVPGADPERRWVKIGCGHVSGGSASTAPAAPAPAEGDKSAAPVSGKPEYVLALSWQPAFCETKPGKTECKAQTAAGFDATHFTLHGLWPQPNGNFYCQVAAADKANDNPAHWQDLPAVELGYVDQSRDQLDPSKTVWEEISGGAEVIKLGKFEANTRAYCASFNFRGGDQQQKVGNLSGGQRNRVHLAKMLKTGGNVLLLDEPTNDLDTETLAALEDALENFAGCAVIISHDRMFLDRLATHILAFEGDSHVEWFEGNFEDYEQDKIRRLGPDAINPHRMTYKRLTR